MKFRLAAFAALLSPLLSDASFLRDVARASNKKKLVENALMAKAVPLDQYRQGLRDQGYDISTSYRGLEEGDDYFMDANNMYSFSGYSMKYAECQPVQKFSEDAISAGEYTPMVLDDIVILRLCPSSSCSSSDSYGCYNNFAEYAISVGDYIRVMLRYKMDQEEQLCEWCNECIGRRRLDGEDNNNQDQGQNDGQQDGGDQDQADQGNQDQDGNNNGQDQDQQDQGNDNQQQQQQDNDENDGNQQNNDDEQQADEGNDDQQNDDGNENQAVGDDYWSNNYQGDYGYYQGNGGCDDYETYCYDESGYAVCDEDAGDDSYLDAEGYLNYMDCVNVDGYYIRPRCDGYDKSISMGVFYDPFCSQYAGDNINMNNLGLGIETDFFEEFYDDVECMECSQSNYAPYFNANMSMCNALHSHSEVCSNSLQYDMFGSNGADQSTCSFIESIRFGSYNEDGQLLAGWKYGRSAARKITEEQKWMVTLSVLLCVALGLYSCYLHHSITNLLIQSLSHSDLLPSRSRGSSRHSRSRRSSRSNSRSRRRKMITVSDDDEDSGDWDRVRRPPKRSSSRSSRVRR